MANDSAVPGGVTPGAKQTRCYGSAQRGPNMSLAVTAESYGHSSPEMDTNENKLLSVSGAHSHTHKMAKGLTPTRKLSRTNTRKAKKRACGR